MAKKDKICPFISQNCIKTRCELYNGILNRCDIGVLSYNLYRLSEIERQILENSSEKDQSDLILKGQPIFKEKSLGPDLQ